jgi:hypothetical protein
LVAKGKGRNFTLLAWRIEQALLPRWGNTPIAEITEDNLNDWVEHEYRVLVRAKPDKRRGKDEPKPTPVWKQPSASTLGNLDWAFRHVWDQAVIANPSLPPTKINPALSVFYGCSVGRVALQSRHEGVRQ